MSEINALNELRILADTIEMEDVYHINCRSCHKPIVANVTVIFDVTVDKDKSAIESEKQLYEKRMRGDWS